MSAIDTPSALAFSRSISSLNCGASSTPFGRTATSARVLRRRAEQLVARREQRLVAEPPRSCSSCRSRTRCRAPRPAAARSRRSARRGWSRSSALARADERSRCATPSLRWPQSFSLTKTRPVFWPAPAKLKPDHGQDPVDRVALLCRGNSPARVERPPACAPAMRPAASARGRTGCPCPPPAGTTSACARREAPGTATRPRRSRACVPAASARRPRPRRSRARSRRTRD